MAASLKFSNGFIADWHVGQKAPFEREQIKDCVDVWIDGDELEWFYDKGIKRFEGRVIKFVEAASFIAYIIWNETQDLKRPIITEEGINNLLGGDKKSPQN